MKKICLASLALFALMNFGCSESKEINPERKKHQIEKSEYASRAYYSAVSLAEGNEPAGFLKLYEIANDDITYTVEYRELAYDELSLLLYTRTEMWIKTFSKVDQSKFRKFFDGVNDSQLPEGVSSSEQFLGGILKNLKKLKGDQKEMELVNYLQPLLEQNK
jgi:uncharacterized protein YcfL